MLADLRSGGRLTAAAIAARYAQGRKIEPCVQKTLEARERLGHVGRGDDGFTLRKAA